MSPRSGEAAGSGGKPCFLKGTRIRVVGGEKRIEDIRIGDLVSTKSGIAKPVRWVARRRYRKEPGSPWVENIQPVRIAQDALGPNTPSSDLFISDTHALHFDGNLIPALDLLNDMTIARYPAKEFDEIAAANCHLLFLDRRDFLAALADEPGFGIKLLAFLCRRLRQTSEQVEDLTFADPSIRLAKALLQLAERQGTIPIVMATTGNPIAGGLAETLPGPARMPVACLAARAPAFDPTQALNLQVQAC